MHGLLIAPQAVQPASIRSAWGGGAVLGVRIAIAPTPSAIFAVSRRNVHQPEPFLVSGVVGELIREIRWLGFTRYTTHDATQFRDACCLGPSHPDTNARCTAMMIRPYKLRDSPGRRC